MEAFDEEFQFSLELIILSRNKEGATLWEIRDDYYDLLGVKFESILGYNWEEQMRLFMTNFMLNVYSKTVKDGLILYYMNIEAAIAKLTGECSETIVLLRSELKIDLDELKKLHNDMMRPQSRPRSTNYSQTKTKDIKNGYPKLTNGRISRALPDCEFYGFSLIGDDFFLEMAKVDLQLPVAWKNQTIQIGQCISGQTIKSAIKNVSNNLHKIREKVVINLGSLDLLQGRELIDMMRDICTLANTLVNNNVFPILTTLPPLANHMHDRDLERKRKAFNQFLLDNFDVIDIEHCFLSSYGRILFDVFEIETQHVVGSRHPLVIWNHIGRQRVVKMLKRKIPVIYNGIYEV